jgi:hypothetical protein
MLIADRRLRTIFIALAGMEAAVTTAYLLLLFHYEWLWRQAATLLAVAPLTLLLSLWVGFLGMIIAVDLLGHSKLSDTGYRLAVLGLVLATALVGTRLFIYPHVALFDLHWAGEMARMTLNFHGGLHPSTFILFLVLFLWLRASSITGREITFLGVGFNFRLGLLLLFCGAGILVVIERALTAEGIALLLIYIAVGLLAVALARSDEKSEAAPGSAGSTLPLSRLAQLLLMVGLTVGLTMLIAIPYTPARMRATLAIFSPLWRLLEWLALLLLAVAIVVVERIVFWIYMLLAPLLAKLKLDQVLAELAANLTLGEPDAAPVTGADPSPYTDLLFILIRCLVVGGAVFVAMALIYLFLVRRRARHAREEKETTTPAGAELGGNPLRRGWDRLKHWADLVRHYGLGMRLLDAITVENIYANLSRLARQRGQPRRAAQPPDEYLPVLQRAFPGHDEALNRITAAYMQVHYGDEPIYGEALQALRADYERIRQEGDDEI